MNSIAPVSSKPMIGPKLQHEINHSLYNVVKANGETFREYERQHRLKAHNTLYEGEEHGHIAKADANKAMAEKCEEALRIADRKQGKKAPHQLRNLSDSPQAD